MLVSKLQYFFYEVGEFSDIENRSLEQTIDLLKNYPWEEQRRSSFVSLDGASVTIEGRSGSFLKIGLYYHGKFALYLLNRHGKLFMKIADTWEKVLLIVNDFYNSTVREQDFVRYRAWVYSPSRHFVTREFKYSVSFTRVFWFLVLPVSFALFLLFIIAISFSGNGFVSGKEGIFPILVLLFMVLSGVKILLFLHYYWFSRRLYLKISKGIDDFHFGKGNIIERYRKQDIESIKEYSNSRTRAPWNDCYIYVIRMKDGKILKLTNLLISSFTFGEKFPNHSVQGVHKFIATVNNCN